MEKLKLTQQEALDMLSKMNISFGQQNLVWYSQEGDFNKVELLLIAGANPNICWTNSEAKSDVYGLHNTCLYGKGDKHKMVELLLEYGADINLKDKDGYTALHLAIKDNQPDMVKLLIENGADVNILTKDNRNPLFIAEKKQNEGIIELLKNAGARKMNEAEVKAHKQSKTIRLVSIGICILICFGIGKMCSGDSKSSSGSYSSGSSSSSEHTCTWCGKAYSGNGYNHLGGSGATSYCAEATHGWEKQNQCCSIKCCEEQSNE